MTVFFNNLNRILKGRPQFLLIIILPALLMLPISLEFITVAQSAIKIGIIDQDGTGYSTLLADNLAAQGSKTAVEQARIQDGLLNSQVDYVVVIQKGFTKSLLQGKVEQLQGYYLQGSVKSLLAQTYLESFVAASRRIAAASGGSEEKFYQDMQLYKNAGLRMNFQVPKLAGGQPAYFSLGSLLTLMLVTTVLYTTLVLTDKDSRTFYRTIVAPVTVRSYMLQNILSFLFVSFFQVGLALAVLKEIAGIYLGDPVLMYLLFFTASVFCVSYGVAISSLSKSVVQASLIGFSVAFALGILGGCFWEPRLYYAGTLLAASKFTPVYWIMDGVGKLLNQQNSAGIYEDLLITLVFAIVFFLLGTWRREDIAK